SALESLGLLHRRAVLTLAPTERLEKCRALRGREAERRVLEPARSAESARQHLEERRGGEIDEPALERRLAREILGQLPHVVRLEIDEQALAHRSEERRVG